MFRPRLLAFALCLFAADAHAQSDPRDVALALARAGRELLEAGDAEGAYRSFEQAERHFHAPTHLLYMARARARQGLLLEARALYGRVLAEELGDDATPPFIEAQSSARHELAVLEPRIPTLTVRIRGTGAATVYVDGAAMEKARIALNPGKHTVIARAPGRDPLVRTVTLRAGAHESLVLGWPAPRAMPLVPPPEETARPWIAPAVVSFAVGTAGVIAGSVTGVLTLDRVAELDARCPDRVCPVAEQEGADDIRTLAHGSTAAFVVGGVGLVAGAVLVIVRPGETSVEARGGQLWLRSAF